MRTTVVKAVSSGTSQQMETWLARDGRIVATGCSLNGALKERVNHPGNSVGSGLVTLGSLAVHGQLQQEVVYVGHPNKRLRTPRARPEHKLWPYVAFMSRAYKIQANVCSMCIWLVVHLPL